MIIENPEAFKAWMAQILEPMCDADPEALAKYIYALVKKDKPTDELRKSTVAQLEVFLNKETKGFVDLMFTKLEVGFKDDPTVVKIKEEPMDKENRLETGSDESLLLGEETTLEEPQSAESAPPIPAPIVPENIPIPATVAPTPVVADSKPIVVFPPAKEPVPVRPESPRPTRNGTYESSANQNKVVERERRVSASRSDRKSDSDRDCRGEPSRWRGTSVSPPARSRIDRSRSRSWERRSATRRSRSRSRRSRSRGRERDRSRAWRNKSPPLRSRYDRDRKIRSWSKSPPPRSRSRSPHSKIRSRYRNRSPIGRSRSRSLSPYDSPHKSPLSGRATPTNVLEDIRVPQGIQSVVLSKKRRCRDFDEKGFCMRGEMCPYDHGKDPVVLEGVGQVLSSFAAPGLPPPAIDPPASSMVPPALAMVHHRPQLLNRPPLNHAEYNPDAPSMEPRMWSKAPFRSAVGRGGLIQRGGMMRGPPGFAPHHQRELINVPVNVGEEGQRYFTNAGKRPLPQEFTNSMETMPPAKQRFDFSRLGRQRNGNCSLQLKKIPPGLNNIAHLHNHFFKFGKIVNIQVSFEGDPEAALITFTSHAEASAAYKSTEAVLNNRFIKVFWYNPDKEVKQENIAPLHRPSAKERLGAPVVSAPAPAVKLDSEIEKVYMTGAGITKTLYIPTVMERKQAGTRPVEQRMIVQTTFQQTHNIEIQNTRNSIKKKQEEKRKEALKLTQHLCKRKHELIEKLLYHQKQLIDKLEKGNIAPEQRAEILTAIKGFQENIDTIRKDIKTVVAKPVNNAVKVSPQLVKRTREETQKQILDAELDLFNQQQEGKDTSELQKRVIELKTKAHNLGLLANNGVLRLTRGGARFRTGRGRGGFNPHATVDHRPTKLLVSGFESDDKAEVLQHFTKFGEVADHIWDEATPALVIQFKTRKDAETAMAKGRNFQDRLLSVTWFSSAQNMGVRSSRSVILLNDSAMSDLLSEHEDEEEALRINLDQNEDFLLQDEEEEEDEERSWRR